MAQAFSEVVGSSVGWEAPAQVTRRAEIPTDLSGAFIPLAGEGLALQLGLTGTEAACRSVAAALLQCSADEAAAMPMPEVADSVCEVVNIAAGHVKARLAESQHGIALGLPLFVHGAVQPGERMDVNVFDLRYGEVPLVLVMLHRRG
jgi:CheY-specific phosphatase CheX